MLAAGLAKRYGGNKPLAPLGIHGEAIIDLTASDALAAGFSRVVLVVGPKTAPAIDYHLRRRWPAWVDVESVPQPAPFGTAHALLCARDLLGDRPFGVVNGDDVYGAGPLSLLHRLLEDRSNANVCFRLADTILSDEPVTRGVAISKAPSDGDPGLARLAGLVERRSVKREADGTFRASDGLEPQTLDPDSLVSMNLWGFQPEIWGFLEAAVLRDHPDVAPNGTILGGTVGDDVGDDVGGAGRGAAANAGDLKDPAETLLPEVVGDAVKAGSLEVKIAQGEGRCVGVTHADDLSIARAELARMTGRGERAEPLWQTGD
jgi:UTP-glucose-1-phosphate uridylyltransferase